MEKNKTANFNHEYYEARARQLQADALRAWWASMMSWLGRQHASRTLRAGGKQARV